MKSKKAKKPVTKRQTVNQRVGTIFGTEGALAQYGYFTPKVQNVVRRWRDQRRALDSEIQAYYMRIATAALQEGTRERLIQVNSAAHWSLIGELMVACGAILKIPKEHPYHWLLLKVRTNLGDIGEHGERTWKSWGEISAEIVRLGGPDFGGRDGKATSLRQAAKRLKLVASAETQLAARQK